MKMLREIVFIGLFDILPTLRDPMALVFLGQTSLLPVFFVYVLAGGDPAMNALAGSIVLSFTLTGIETSSSVYLNKNWFRFQDMYVASGIRPFSYAFGLAFGTLVLSGFTVMFSLVVVLAVGKASIVGCLLGLTGGLMLWLSFVLLGFTIGSRTQNIQRVNSMPPVLALLLGYIPPVYYSISNLPLWLQWLALALPTTNAANLLKHYLGLERTSPEYVLVAWVYLLVFALVAITLSSRYATWTEKGAQLSIIREPADIG